MATPDTADAKASKPATGDGAVCPADVENPTPVSSVARRFRDEGFLGKAALGLRAAAWLFSALAFLVMACNKHGDWRSFDNFQEYRYLVAITVLAFLYTTVQLVRRAPGVAGWVRAPSTAAAAAALDFTGDQVTAYLLISALSAAAPITGRIREGGDNVFTDSSAASISMAFFAFAALALAALVSGLKLSRQIASA